MDKRDFYREIMEKYAFDRDKIYTNAKNGKYIGNKHRQPYPLYIGMTAAVAAVVVTVSTLTAARLGDPSDVVEPLPGDATVLSLPEETETSSSSAKEDPPVSESASTERISEDTSGLASPIMTDFSSDPAVGSNGPQTSDVSTVGESTAASDSSQTTSSAASDTTATGSSTDNTGEPAVPVSPGVKKITEVQSVFPTEIGSFDDSLPSIPLEMLLALPGDASLPFNPDRFSYLTEDIGAKQAYFLNDNTVYVRTAEDMRLYTMNGGELALAASQSCPNAVTFWIAENGGRQLAFDNGALYDVNAQNGTITEHVLGVGGEILEIAYNEDAGVLALNVSDNGKYSLIVYVNGFDEAKVLYDSAAPFSLVAATATVTGLSDPSVFFAESSDSELLIYKASVGGDVSPISNFQGKFGITRNSAFTHAVLDGEVSDLIFDPESFGLIPLSDLNIVFGVSRHSFLSRDGYFTISGGNAAASGGVPVIAQFDFMRSFSQYYLAAAENGAVRVVNGVYTKRAKLDDLTFDAPEETASAAMRMAVNAAVALQNTLGGGLCESIGIVDTATLDGLIKVCFGEEAGAALRQRCSVGEGDALTYSGGMLDPINLSDTVLVISEETETAASGTLYVKAGSFGGNTAYYSCAVKLQKTESGYVAAQIIE